MHKHSHGYSYYVKWEHPESVTVKEVIMFYYIFPRDQRQVQQVLGIEEVTIPTL